MQATQNSASLSNTFSGNRSRLNPPTGPSNARRQPGDHGGEVSIWIRLGLPLTLALVAATLNAAAVRSQIKPVYAYTFSRDLPAGTRLQAEHLTSVELAGNMDRSFLLLPDDLLIETHEQDRLSLEQSLEQRARVLSKPMGKGELLSQACLGGLNLSELRSTDQMREQMVDLPRSLIVGDGTGLLPGKKVFFLVKNRYSQDDASREIGPFRVGLRESEFRSQGSASEDSIQEDLPIIYVVDKRGEPTQHSRVLLDAVQNEWKLTIIHKAIDQ